MSMNLYLHAKELQHLAGRFLDEPMKMHYTDIEEWKEVQARLRSGIDHLVKRQGTTPDEEAERLLAILMGYCVAVRDSRCVEHVLWQAEQVLHKVQDPVLKCYLTVFCYLECPDEELGEQVHQQMTELRETGRGEELKVLEKLLENIEVGEAAIR